MLSKLNLGCGSDIRKGFLNVDFEKFPGVDLVENLNQLPYSFKKSQFTEIVMKNILEHLDDSYQVMKEIYRIAAPDCKIFIQTPHFSSNNTWGDLQHKRGFNTDSFKNPNMASMFEVVNQEITFPPIRFFMRSLAKISYPFYERNFAYLLPATDLLIELRAKK